MTGPDDSVGMSAATQPGRYLPAAWVVPALTEQNRAFFTSGALSVQRCRACGNVQHPPIELCSTCQAFDLELVPASGRGTVVAMTVVHQALHPLLEASVPYNVVVVALDDHPSVRVVGNVVTGSVPVHIGMHVVIEWAMVADCCDGEQALLLPQWRGVPDR